MLNIKFHIYFQGFGQHAEETDPERIEQITKRALEDSQWILNKVMKYLGYLHIITVYS